MKKEFFDKLTAAEKGIIVNNNSIITMYSEICVQSNQNKWYYFSYFRTCLHIWLVRLMSLGRIKICLCIVLFFIRSKACLHIVQVWKPSSYNFRANGFSRNFRGGTGCPITLARSVHLSYYSGSGNNYGTLCRKIYYQKGKLLYSCKGREF